MRRAYLCICCAISVGLIALAVFPFRISYMRLWESMKDFGLSIAMYFCDLFEIEHSISPTVIYRSGLFISAVTPSPSPSPSPPSADLPNDFEVFQENVGLFFELFFRQENFRRWIVRVILFLMDFSQILSLTVMIGGLLWYIFGKIYGRQTLKRGDTRMLKVFKVVTGITYQPIKNFIVGFIRYIREEDKFWRIWLAISLISLNLITIAVEFFAYYFYFLVEFEFSTIYLQFVKLGDDLQVILHNFPWWSIVTFGVTMFCKWRVNKALDMLRHMDAMNYGFIKSLPLGVLIVGLMGSGKTTLMVSIIRYRVVLLRQQVLDILLRTDMKFPFFSWIRLEDELRQAIADHVVYNKASAEEWARKRFRYIENARDLRRSLYGYDFRRYGLTFDDGLNGVTLFQALETYAQAYYVYVFSSSLAVCNFSVRTNECKIDIGNFPMWLQDFYSGRKEERRAHIMDWDAFRLGKKMIEDNPNIGAWEFGVAGEDELGKERLNSIELQEVKKSAKEANQKNDGFNNWLKMFRHGGTIDNEPLVSFLGTEQRAESWGVDARGLVAVLHAGESSEAFSVLPFGEYVHKVSDWLYQRFKVVYLRFRYNRGDNTLFMHVLKSITFFFWKINFKNANLYGYKVMNLEIESGTLDGEKKVHPYYLPFKQVYGTFMTDCFGDYFKEKALATDVSFDDWPEFAGERASRDEQELMNSYFMRDLYGN